MSVIFEKWFGNGNAIQIFGYESQRCSGGIVELFGHLIILDFYRATLGFLGVPNEKVFLVLDNLRDFLQFHPMEEKGKYQL